MPIHASRTTRRRASAPRGAPSRRIREADRLPGDAWRRGARENADGLLRRRFPEGADPTLHGLEEPDAVAAVLDGRSRETLGWRTPAEAMDELDAPKNLPVIASFRCTLPRRIGRARILQRSGPFGPAEHLERRSRRGDPPEVLEPTVDFVVFRPWLVEGLGYGDGSKGGRPPFDPVSMFKALIVQAQHKLSDAGTDFMIRDRLSWMRFPGFDPGAPTPEENKIRRFRDRMAETGALTWKGSCGWPGAEPSAKRRRRADLSRPSGTPAAGSSVRRSTTASPAR